MCNNADFNEAAYDRDGHIRRHGGKQQIEERHFMVQQMSLWKVLSYVHPANINSTSLQRVATRAKIQTRPRLPPKIQAFSTTFLSYPIPTNEALVKKS